MLVGTWHPKQTQGFTRDSPVRDPQWLSCQLLSLGLQHTLTIVEVEMIFLTAWIWPRRVYFQLDVYYSKFIKSLSYKIMLSGFSHAFDLCASWPRLSSTSSALGTTVNLAMVGSYYGWVWNAPNKVNCLDTPSPDGGAVLGDCRAFRR